MEDKIFKVATILSTIGIAFLGEFIVFMTNYGLMPQNILWVIIETIGVLLAAYGFYVAVTSFYAYCDEIEEEMEGNDDDKLDRHNL